MKLPAFIRPNRFGIYYMRFVISQKLRRKYTDIQKEYRVSLNTNKKSDALRKGCALYARYQDLFSDPDAMGDKVLFEGEEIEGHEMLERLKLRNQAREDLKKARRQQRQKGIYDHYWNQEATEEEKRQKLLDGAKQVQNGNGKVGQHRIADVINEYINWKKTDKAWTKKTEQARKAIFKIFSEIMGDRCFDTIGFRELDHYRNCISKLPRNLNADNRYKGKSVLEIIQLQNVDLVSNDTRNKHYGNISYLFNWAVGRGYSDRNYAAGLTTKDKKRKKTRDLFTQEDLQKIISGDEYMRVNGKKHKYHAYFWLPLISMFTGARISEICQLRVSDIREEKGIEYFAFCSDGIEAAKTEAAIRNTPIHDVLIKLGFLKFVNWRKKNKEERLFSEIKEHPQNGYGDQASRWFNRTYLIQVGVKDPIKGKNKKVHHSFRHTLINHLQRKGVSENRIHAIEGHVHDDLSYYQHDQGLKEIAEEIAKIDYEIDFSHLFDKHRNEYLGM